MTLPLNSPLVARKHPHTSALDAVYAQYGLRKGYIPEKQEKLLCVVISTGWPSWVISASARGMNIVLVICNDLAWLDLIQFVSSSSKILVWSKISQGLSGLPTVDFVFLTWTSHKVN